MAQPRSTASSTGRAPPSSINPFARFMYAATFHKPPSDVIDNLPAKASKAYCTPKAHSHKEECDMKLQPRGPRRL